MGKSNKPERISGKNIAMNETNKNLVRRYYEEIWNQWDDEAVDQLIAADISFHGSLGISVEGLDGFRDYVARVRAAFPDFHNAINDLIAESDNVVAVLTYTGTHCGELFGIAPTGRRISYRGIAVFQIRDGKISKGYVLGDTQTLRTQLE